MHTIRFNLEQAEYDALERYAATLDVKPADVLYCALNRLMLDGRNPDTRKDILETRDWRQHNLPLWSDSAGSVHAYEGKADDDPAPSKYL